MTANRIVWMATAGTIAIISGLILVFVVVQDSGRDAVALTPEFAEPVKLSSTEGRLEVTLTARQSSTRLNTVVEPVTGMLLYDYEIQQGESSSGDDAGSGLYPAPTLAVQPGDQLVVHMQNELRDLTIEDFIDPVLTPAGEKVPLTPDPATETPINLHTHGLHVSPNGNSDNVLLEIDPGERNTFTYDIPADHPQGLYWYHPHRHQLTETQVYRGLAGMLTVGRPEGAIPAVVENDLPVRSMALQFNFVGNRQGGQSQLNYPTWTQMVNTGVPAKSGQVESGSYEPNLAPVNFSQAENGTTFKTSWFSGPLSVENKRGVFQFLPQNLQDFVAKDPSKSSPADPSLPDHERDVQFTVNGQFQPVVTSRPGQTEIWAIGNVSSQGYMNLAVRATETGELVPLRVLARDGNATTTVGTGMNAAGTTYLLPPASRVAIAVTLPLTGGLELEMPPVEGPDAKYTQPLSTPGVLYTSNGTKNPPGVLGRISASPKNISWLDGFKTFPTQKLLTAKSGGDQGQTVEFAVGSRLSDDSPFVDTAAMPVDNTRKLTIGGGSSHWVSKKDPNAFMYEFQDSTWPTTPTLHPRLNSVEEWQFTNNNNDQHPIHVHVNDFQVTKLVDPVGGTRSGAQPYGYDNYNTPAPTLDADGNAVTSGQMHIRTLFQDYTGTFVMHCHRLDHEDNGLMITVNVIPEVSTFATVSAASQSAPSRIQIRDQANNALVGTATPFPASRSTPTATMADVDGDQVLDLVVGSGPGSRPMVVAYSGAGPIPFSRELARFDAFESDFTGGVRVAAGRIDGSPLADNIIVASGPGRFNEVRVFSTELPSELGTTPTAAGSFRPSEGEGGVDVAAGLTDPMGRFSIVTAPADGSAVKVFRYSLMEPIGGGEHSHVTESSANFEASGDLGVPEVVTEFAPFQNYQGRLSLATGWIAGDQGGVESIVVGQATGKGQVRVFSSGSNLTGQSPMYVESFHDQMNVTFKPTMTFQPMSSGVSVATTSITSGATLLIAGRQDGEAVTLGFGVQRSTDRPTQLAAIPTARIPTTSGTVQVAGD